MSRVGSGDFGGVNAFLRSDEFGSWLQGAEVTLRHWDGQLRQPIIVGGPGLWVSVAPGTFCMSTPRLIRALMELEKPMELPMTTSDRVGAG